MTSRHRREGRGFGLALVLAASCGSVPKAIQELGIDGDAGGDGSGGTTNDGGGITDGRGTTDGSDGHRQDGGTDAAVRCGGVHPFGAPVLLAGVNGSGGSAGEGRLSADELTIFFFSDRSGNNDIFMATRPSRIVAFGTPQAVGGVNSPALEGWPSLTADGLTMFLESTIDHPYQVMVATRTTIVAQFSAPAPVANLNAGGIDGQPFVLPDESALYFASDRTGGSGRLDLYRAERTPGGQFGIPAKVSTVNSPSDEYGPMPSADDLTFYFASTRTDAPARGSLDIWMSQRTSRVGTFDPPVNVQELNTSDTEWPDWLSPDGCRLYFTRTSNNTRKIFVAERTM